MIIDPTGEMLGLSVSKLTFLPFRSYLIPGIMLLVVNGISSLSVAVCIVKKIKNAPVLILLQGIISTIWIIIEASAIPYSNLQYVFGTIGILLTGLGLRLISIKRS